MPSPDATVSRSPSIESERIVAWLRLPAIGVLLLSQTLPHPNAEREWFYVALGLFAAWGVAALVWTAYGPATGRFALAATVLDIAFFTVLTVLSGGPFSNARFAYLVVPVIVAFRMRPPFTALATAAVVVAYVAQGLAHPASSQTDAGRFIVTFALFLVWAGSACVLLSALLAERTRSITDLLAARTGLLVQILSAEERERRALAESLHDGAVQSLLAARQDLDDLDPGHTGAAPVARARHALDETLRGLRTAVYELHPYVLDEVGLTAAVRAFAEHAADRAGLELDLHLGLERTDSAETDALLYSAARELIGNVARHAEARRLGVRLTEQDGSLVLGVEDDGRGIDPARLASRLSEGHIGLASQRARVEAAGGSLDIVARAGKGTRVEVRVPSPDRTRQADVEQPA